MADENLTAVKAWGRVSAKTTPLMLPGEPKATSLLNADEETTRQLADLVGTLLVGRGYVPPVTDPGGPTLAGPSNLTLEDPVPPAVPPAVPVAVPVAPPIVRANPRAPEVPPADVPKETGGRGGGAAVEGQKTDAPEISREVGALLEGTRDLLAEAMRLVHSMGGLDPAIKAEAEGILDSALKVLDSARGLLLAIEMQASPEADQPGIAPGDWSGITIETPTPGVAVEPEPVGQTGTTTEIPPAGQTGKTPEGPPVGQTGTAISAAEREALVRKVKAGLGPQAGLLDGLEASGTLNKVGQDGKTVLEGLADLAQTDLSPEAKALGFTRSGVLEQTVRDLGDPESVRQRSDSDCVWTNLRAHLSRDLPADYVRVARDLYRDGKVDLGQGSTVRLADAVKPFDIGGSTGTVFYRNGEPWVRPVGGGEMSLDAWVEKHMFDDDWLNGMIAGHEGLDNPIVRGYIELARSKWREGKKAEVYQTTAGLLDMYLAGRPDKENAAIRFAIQNISAVQRPPAQAVGALPKGLPLGQVAAFFPGTEGYLSGPDLADRIGKAVDMGVEVPMAVKNGPGEPLHLLTVLGRLGADRWLVYDPTNGPTAIGAAELNDQAAGVFLPAHLGKGLARIPADAKEPVGGGRAARRAVFA